MGYGRFLITEELFLDLLKLPEGTRVERVEKGAEDQNIAVIVTHADIQSGVTITELCPTYRREGDEVLFGDWDRHR